LIFSIFKKKQVILNQDRTHASFSRLLYKLSYYPIMKDQHETKMMLLGQKTIVALQISSDILKRRYQFKESPFHKISIVLPFF